MGKIEALTLVIAIYVKVSLNILRRRMGDIFNGSGKSNDSGGDSGQGKL